MMRWNSEITAPSNSAPRPVLTVVGENAFQMMDSHWFVAMNSEMPLPRPYPFVSISSRQMTIMPAMKSCRMMRIAFPAPRSLTSP